MASKSDQSALPPYEYKRLSGIDSIRILKIQHTTESTEQLNVELVKADRNAILASTSDIKGYEAVSYCWEGQEPSIYIKCDGLCRLSVTPNVENILQRLCKSHKPRFLWIDAVCLNQGDLREKGEQVQKMGEIYQCASKVHIWLGEPQHGDRIQALLAGLKAVAKLRGDAAKDFQGLHDTLKHICGDDYGAQLERFFSRPWFGRRWVLQECALNPDIDVRCGESKIAWTWLVKAAMPISLLAGRMFILKQPSIIALNMLLSISTAPEKSLADLLWNFPDSNCQLPDDRIFALSGMATDWHKFESADYDIDWAETFTRVAETYFAEGSLEMYIHLLSFGPIPDSNWPSWIPDWGNQRECHRLYWNEAPECQRSAADDDQLIFLHSDRTLSILSMYYGVVHWNDSSSDPKSRFHLCIEASHEGENWTVHRLTRALWAAVQSIVYKPEDNFPEEDPWEQDFSEWGWRFYLVRSAVRKILDSQEQPSVDENAKLTELITSLISDALDQYSLVLVKEPSGMVCLGPKSIQNGDLVLTHRGFSRLMVFGKKVDTDIGFVVRPQPGAPDFQNCRFIGLCFMAGEYYGGQTFVEII